MDKLMQMRLTGAFMKLLIEISLPGKSPEDPMSVLRNVGNMKKSNVSTVGMDTGTHKMDSDEENYGDRCNDVSHMKDH